MSDLREFTRRQRLLDWQPLAENIQWAGECDICHSSTLYTYQLPEDVGKVRESGNEPCGYWCATCQWANAGSREVKRHE